MSRGGNRGHEYKHLQLLEGWGLGKILAHFEPQFPFRKCKDNHFHLQNNHEDELRQCKSKHPAQYTQQMLLSVSINFIK